MSRRNLVLLLLAVLSVGVYILVDPGTGEEEGPPAIRPFGFLRDDGSAREIFVSGPSAGPFCLTREAYRWHLSEPIRAPADAAVVEQLLTLAESVVLEPIDIPATDLEPYGLLPAERLEVRIAAASGDASTFYLGRKLPLDVIHTYALLPGEETLYRTLSDYRDLFSREIDSLLDARLLPVEATVPARLIIETEAGRIEVTRKDGEFFLGPGDSQPADETRILEVTRVLKETRFRRSESVTGEPSMRENTLSAVSPGHARLTFAMATGENIVVTLPVSADCPERAVWTSLWPEHTLVVDEALPLPELSRQTILDRRLLPLSPGEVRRIGIEHAKGGVFIRREGSGWSVFPPDSGTPGATAVVHAAIRSLGALRGEAFVDQVQAPGIEPIVTLEAVTRDGEEGSVVIFEGEDGRYLAKSSRYRRLLEVALDVVETLLVEPGVFVDKALVAFDLPEVSRIDILSDGRQFMISREAGGDWYLRRPRRRLLGTPRVVGFLFALRDLEHTGERVKDATRDAGARGPEPNLLVTLEGRDGEVLSWVALRGNTAASDRFEGSYKVSADAVAPLYALPEGLEAEPSAGR